MSLVLPLPLLTEHTRPLLTEHTSLTPYLYAFQTQDRNALQKQVSGGGVVIYQTTNTLYQSDILNILCDQLQDESRISDIPPMKPRANELYLIRSEQEDDWKCDQYQWINDGNSSVTMGNKILKKKFYKIKLPGMKTNNAKTKKRPVGSLDFKRTAYYFEDNKTLVLVYYEGDETVYVPTHHGNSKKTASEFARTAPSVLRRIENALQSGDKTAMDIYRESVCDLAVPGTHQGILNVRNVKQVENIVRKVNEDKRISKDDVYNLVLLAYHLEGFIHEVTVFPDLTSIIALSDMISIVNQLLDVNTTDYIPFVFFYDTTFKLGDFYVSPLVFRNIIFENEPIMPVAFLIHARKKEKVHSKFFDFVASLFPKLNKKAIPFVTNREPGLVNAIMKNFSNCDVVMCWNHLINDFKFNLQKMIILPCTFLT
ncbi:Hypothetical predicted protein [Mytilus galloprovincialis]|uniref:CG-1 domain-containing protein n=1 Tax=Mytilus galloprovincialis TaxID=29158 RepID=A0A8B6EKD7_MYTGA|nr:Hypothetical predicted protein [Mytilus galloprovincialis]